MAALVGIAVLWVIAGVVGMVTDTYDDWHWFPRYAVGYSLLFLLALAAYRGRAADR